MLLMMFTSAIPLPDCWNSSLLAFELASYVLPPSIAQPTMMAMIAQARHFRSLVISLRTALSMEVPKAQTNHGMNKVHRVLAKLMEANRAQR